MLARPAIRYLYQVPRRCMRYRQCRVALTTPLRTPPSRSPFHHSARPLANFSNVDEAMEEIQDQYATAKDEFEIAVEETEKQTVYAEEDRKAAREELDKLHELFNEVVGGPDKAIADQVRQRVGQRIRELDNAVHNMEELAKNQD